MKQIGPAWHLDPVLTLVLTLALNASPYPAPLEAWGCATCHAASHPKHDPKALRVFDLDAEAR